MTPEQLFERTCILYTWIHGAATVAESWEQLEAAVYKGLALPQYQWVTTIGATATVIQVTRVHFDRWTPYLV